MGAGKRISIGDALRDAGNPRDGVLLFQIRRWFRYASIQRDGKLWIIKSGAEWSDETGLSVDQVHRAMAALANRGLIEKRRHEWHQGGSKRVLAWVRPRGIAVPGTA